MKTNIRLKNIVWSNVWINKNLNIHALSESLEGKKHNNQFLARKGFRLNVFLAKKIFQPNTLLTVHFVKCNCNLDIDDTEDATDDAKNVVAAKNTENP